MLGENLRILRKRLGFSQAQFAKRLGITGAALSKIENGLTKSPRVIIIRTLHNEYGVNLTWLSHGAGDVFVKGNTRNGDDLDR
jgi:transcriptional regulator with XRE-family HTH domain